jgi:NAD(P)-dependent dehydrogenase (short-subunit alcohol dehydrogenase family)
MNGVLITAGGNGIGRAMGQAFAAAGFRVWVTDVEAASLEACPADWQKSLVDASDERQVAQLFAPGAGLRRYARMRVSPGPRRRWKTLSCLTGSAASR